MKDNALRINPLDNVAIAIQPIAEDGPVIIGGESLFKAVNDIAASHKVALSPIKPGSHVIRYGEPILVAVADIDQGEWVHLHNAQPILEQK